MSSTKGPRYFKNIANCTAATPVDIREPGFVPQKVVVTNLTNGAKMEWFDDLADAAAIKTAPAGTRSVVGSNGITKLAATATLPAGFQIGNLADVNDTATETMLWEAWG